MAAPCNSAFSPLRSGVLLRAVVSGLVGFLAVGSPAIAGPITSGTDTLDSPATWTNMAVRTNTIGWTVTFGANVSVDWTPSANNYNPASGGGPALEGLMKIIVDFSDNNPVTITFKQTAVGSANNPVNNPRNNGLGLRFNVESININHTGLVPVVDDWTSFGMKLVDPVGQPDFMNDSLDNAGLHPSYPHFHGTGGATSGLSYINGGDPPNNMGKGFMNYGNGNVGPNGTFSTTGLPIHDFEVSGQQRMFHLVLQPNAQFTQPAILAPEPSTLAMLTPAGLLFAAAWWRRRALPKAE